MNVFVYNLKSYTSALYRTTNRTLRHSPSEPFPPFSNAKTKPSPPPPTTTDHDAAPVTTTALCAQVPVLGRIRAGQRKAVTVSLVLSEVWCLWCLSGRRRTGVWKSVSSSKGGSWFTSRQQVLATSATYLAVKGGSSQGRCLRRKPVL